MANIEVSVNKHCLYIFLDEGGNLDFSLKGTKYFSLTSITLKRPFDMLVDFSNYRYDCIEYGHNQEYFHCAEDNKYIRKNFFDIIGNHLDTLRIDSLIVEKSKTGPALQDIIRFYPEMLGYLLQYVIRGTNNRNISKIIVVTDQIPVNKKRRAIEKAIKETLSGKLPQGVSYSIVHHNSKAHAMLQAADYCNWAILRKWERGDEKHYNTIRGAIRSEYEIFRNSQKHYY